jgi:hypothetical protein
MFLYEGINMSTFDFGNDIHPIYMVEDLAEQHAWEFERITEDQIAMVVEGQWRTYSITLAWSRCDNTLRMICTFAMQPPKEKLLQLYEMLNVVNNQCWTGSFNYWSENELMTYRYSLLLTGTLGACPEQIDSMIETAVLSMERYYPAFQLVVWGDKTPDEAMQIAISEAYGHA